MFEGRGLEPSQNQDDRLEAKRRRVLEAARVQFLTHGYADTGIEAIAREAKVSTATLYALFTSKVELFNAVIEEASGHFAARISEVTGASADSLERLNLFCEAYARFMSDPFVRAVFRLVAAERRRFTPIARTFYSMGRTRFGGVLMEMLAGLEAEGRLTCPRKSVVAGQIMGMIEHPTFLVPLVTGGEVEPDRTPEQIARDAVETVMARWGRA